MKNVRLEQTGAVVPDMRAHGVGILPARNPGGNAAFDGIFDRCESRITEVRVRPRLQTNERQLRRDGQSVDDLQPAVVGNAQE